MRGRRAVAGKLDQIKKHKAAQDWRVWATFLRFAASLYDDYPREGKFRGTMMRAKTPRELATLREEWLRSLGSTPLDGLLPWMFREIALDPTAWLTLRLDYLPEIQAWYVNDRPNIMQYSMEQAQDAQRQWHADLKVKEAALSLAKIPSVMEWPDGFTLKQIDDVDLLKDIGRSLGHCYMHYATAASYVKNWGCFTLFDAKSFPRVTTTLKPTNDFEYSHHSISADGWARVGECRGTQNRHPRDEFHPYLYAWLSGVLPPFRPEALAAWGEGLVCVPPKLRTEITLHDIRTFDMTVKYLAKALHTPEGDLRDWYKALGDFKHAGYGVSIHSGVLNLTGQGRTVLVSLFQNGALVPDIASAVARALAAAK